MQRAAAPAAAAPSVVYTRRITPDDVGRIVRVGDAQLYPDGRQALIEDGVAGATRFKDGLGRHGDFAKIR